MSKAGKPPQEPASGPATAVKQQPAELATSPADSGGRDYQRKSTDLIYESMMRGGGEPFGPPFELGVSTLTEKIVKFFKQRSFFGFETIEKARTRVRRNKFTRYGAAPFVGEHLKKRD